MKKRIVTKRAKNTRREKKVKEIGNINHSLLIREDITNYILIESE